MFKSAPKRRWQTVLSGTMLIVSTLAGSPLSGASESADHRWQAAIPSIAQDPASWKSLLHELKRREMPFGALAAASRMIAFFPDLESKQVAYQAVIDLVDQGYPFSERGVFVPGDIEPQGDAEYVNSYNLYKFILNHEKGLDRWARQYYGRLDGERFQKLQFYLAVTAYAQGNLGEAERLLRKVLSEEKGNGSGALARKAARTLARIFFERREYGKSLAVYTSFLLRMNPIQPTDWLETAWNLYHLKRYPEALGMLYNLESRAGSGRIYLEKYTLRALIYRDTCSVPQAEALVAAFDRQFGPEIGRLKQGVSVARFPDLARVAIPGNAGFDQIQRTLEALERESGPSLGQVSPRNHALAEYLYSSETRLLRQRRQAYAELALEASAKQLVTEAENLRFLKFDVAREKYSPDRVFQPGSDEVRMSMAAEEDAEPGTEKDPGFQIRWVQDGSFWRDERLGYKGGGSNQCQN